MVTKALVSQGLCFFDRNYSRNMNFVAHLYLVRSHSQNIKDLRITNKIHKVLLTYSPSKVGQKFDILQNNFLQCVWDTSVMYEPLICPMIQIDLGPDV